MAWLPVVATLSGVVGILVAWYLYLSMPDLRVALGRALRPALRVFEAKYWFDDALRRVRAPGGRRRQRSAPLEAGGRGADRRRGQRAGTVTAAFAEALRPVQTGFVRDYALLILAGAVALLSYLLWS